MLSANAIGFSRTMQSIVTASDFSGFRSRCAAELDRQGINESFKQLADQGVPWTEYFHQHLTPREAVTAAIRRMYRN